jgi:hypothetical protein
MFIAIDFVLHRVTPCDTVRTDPYSGANPTIFKFTATTPAL